jgi:(1->4)-alpha-D-glucan 1-alpha-D-glucosylmutase
VDHEDRIRLESAVAAARTRAGIASRALDLLADALLGDLRRNCGARLSVVQRFQQVSGPAMAKGAEDTAFYVWVPLLSLNEVGGEPDASADDAVARLHRLNAERATRWPQALSCTSTHDTKRSADVRSRLDVLSELPNEWLTAATRWHQRNKRHRPFVRRRRSPDRNLEYLLYQTLAGIWPLPRPGESHDRLPPSTECEALRERLVEYAMKAAREAKVHTSWIDPDGEWEAATTSFVRALFDDRDFLVGVAAFVRRILRPGLWNALARTLVHCTAPGVPDIYQGDEVWNFRLVDPDNRQAVDFELRQRLLADLEARDGTRGALAAELAASPEDLRSKLHVIRVALESRRRFPDVFAGGYRPLAPSGRLADHVIGFGRTAGDAVATVIVPRLTVALARPPEADGEPPIGAVWGDTTIEVPACGSGLVNVLTAERAPCPRDGGDVPLADLFRTFPLALLVPES